MINKSNILSFLSGVALWVVSKTIVMVIHICTQYPVFLIQSIGILKKGKPNTGQVFTGKKSARTFISPYQHLHYPIIFQIYLKNSVLQRTLFLKAITVIYVMNFKKKFCDFRSLWRNCDIDKASSWSVAS